MALDFQQVRRQIKQLGETAPLRALRMDELRAQAEDLINEYAHRQDFLQQRVQSVVGNYEPNLRCGLPPRSLTAAEPLNAHHALPALPKSGTILAADGSQIAPDRHVQVNYSLINVGAIQMKIGSPDAPQVTVNSHLFFDEQLFTPTGVLTNASLALLRDLKERTQLSELAETSSPPVITFTDGPMELWFSVESQSGSEFQRRLQEYLEALARLNELGVVTAGYVDKPAANLVLRLLEVASLPDSLLPEIRSNFPLRGATDFELFSKILAPGERSAVFELQSRSAHNYRDDLALHFFYLNVGLPGRPWTARVEIPAWVAKYRKMLDSLHATLIDQCRVMGNQPYPYLLHRAHEAALVTWQEKEQVTQMIAQELTRQSIKVGKLSHKQHSKNLPGRRAYER